MSNLNINNHHTFRLIPIKNNYWDFFVNPDDCGSYNTLSSALTEDCLISYIDMCFGACLSGDGEGWITSTNDYSWKNGISNETIKDNIGYTGIDNGLVPILSFHQIYDKDDMCNTLISEFTEKTTVDKITNEDFARQYGRASFKITQDDLRLKLYRVSGSTGLYDYPIHENTCSLDCNGGFVQGFFKTNCNEYYILPSQMEQNSSWEFEFEIKRDEFEKESYKTLNDKHPENKGIFFYIGTRAENKWALLYKDKYCSFTNSAVTEDDYFSEYIEDDGSVCTMSGDPIDYEDLAECSICTDKIDETDTFYKKYYNLLSSITLNNEVVIDCDTDFVEGEMDISSVDYKTTSDFSLSGANDSYITTDNKYILFNRTDTGFTVSNWSGDSSVMLYSKNKALETNLFMLANRTPTGFTVNEINELKEEASNSYDEALFYNDLYNNALAFRITDDGEIGYKYLVADCSLSGCDKTSISEGYSFKNEIPYNEWTNIHVRMTALTDTMKLYFYINGKLKYITTELPLINLRKLDELDEKQEGVPFNISLGGGTQGLCETILPNYMKRYNEIYPLEKYFGGSFIGSIKSFKFYDCKLNYNQISENYNYENTFL